MEISRLIFSNETKKKMEEGLTGSQRGKLRWERVKDADENGKLKMAKNRNEVANVAGFTYEDRKRGYQWVSAMIHKKYLEEKVLGIDKHGKMEFEYRIIGEPDFDHKRAQAARWAGHIKGSNDEKRVEKPKKTTKKNVGLKARGKEMFARLKAAIENGEIDGAMTRTELADITNTNRSWVCGLIERGYLKETLVNYTGSIPTYRYSLTDKEPNYTNVKLNSNSITEEKEEDIVQVNNERKEETNNNTIKIEITRNDTTIKLEISDYNRVEELIKTILKGE